MPGNGASFGAAISGGKGSGVCANATPTAMSTPQPATKTIGIDLRPLIWPLTPQEVVWADHALRCRPFQRQNAFVARWRISNAFSCHLIIALSSCPAIAYRHRADRALS